MKTHRIDIWLWGFVCFVCLLTGCGHDAHDGEDDSGLSVFLSWQEQADKDTEVKDIRLWIFNAADGLLVRKEHYGCAQEVAKQRFKLEKGDYRILAAVNLVEPFTISEATRTVREMDELRFGLKTPDASPDNAYFGVGEVTIDRTDAIYAAKEELQRALAELTVIIEGVPDGTVLKGSVMNVAEGFSPLIKDEDGRWGTSTSAKVECSLPTTTAEQGTEIKTETIRLMPTVKGEKATQLHLTLDLSAKHTNVYDIEAPAMKPGVKYQINLKYDEMRPYMYLTTTKINDWTEGWIYKGEILNPDE